jgi:phosphopentomutase
VGRVIARPFTGAEGAFARTQGRRDFTLRPPARSYLQALQSAGVEVHGVGKISDLFAGVGVSRSHAGATNAQALGSVAALLSTLDRGLVFANLIETDQTFGHRKDVAGFARALREVDDWLALHLPALEADDLLVVTADHGVDPAQEGTDHTREYAPLLACTGNMLRGRPGAARGTAAVSAGHVATPTGARHDGPLADVGSTVLRWLGGGEASELPGEPFIS